MVSLEFIPKISAANNSAFMFSQSSFIYSMCTEKSIYVVSLDYCKVVKLVYTQTLNWIYKMELKQVFDTLAFHRYHS